MTKGLKEQNSNLSDAAREIVAWRHFGEGNLETLLVLIDRLSVELGGMNAGDPEGILMHEPIEPLYAAPPAQEDEPVAVVTVTSYYEPGYASIKIDRKIDVGTKLYTRPDNNKLRQAAEAYVKAYKPGWDHHGTEEYKNLRKALGNPHG